MSTVPLGLSTSPSSPSLSRSNPRSPHLHLKTAPPLPAAWPRVSRLLGTTTTTTRRPGVCRASQAVDLFPSICPEIVVRDARLEDCWEVAETHCSSFFPDHKFPIDLVLRIDRFVALLSGFSIPLGCTRTCLVAVTSSLVNDNLYMGSDDLKLGGFGGKFSLNKGSVAGILTVDTVADFLPRKGPFRQRRTGIAYISNVAVREVDRKKGIAKMLVAKAEARARSWGCRSVALHCDASNTAALRLYKSQGFKCINIPENSKWPEPRTTPNMQFYFMMKLLSIRGTT